MKKPEAKALLKYLKARLVWVREQKAKWRRLEAYALTHMAEDDLPKVDKVGFGSNYIMFRDLSKEEDFLVKEIKDLAKNWKGY